jgi:hypothetical protein
LRVGSVSPYRTQRRASHRTPIRVVETWFPKAAPSEVVAAATYPTSELFEALEDGDMVKAGTIFLTSVETWFPRKGERGCQSAALATLRCGRNAVNSGKAGLNAIWQSPDRIELNEEMARAHGPERVRARSVGATPHQRFVKRRAVTSSGRTRMFPDMQGTAARLNLLRGAEPSVSETWFPQACLWRGNLFGRTATQEERFFSDLQSFALALPSPQSSPPSQQFGTSRSPLVETRFPRFRSPHHV